MKDVLRLDPANYGLLISDMTKLAIKSGLNMAGRLRMQSAAQILEAERQARELYPGFAIFSSCGHWPVDTLFEIVLKVSSEKAHRAVHLARRAERMLAERWARVLVASLSRLVPPPAFPVIFDLASLPHGNAGFLLETLLGIPLALWPVVSLATLYRLPSVPPSALTLLCAPRFTLLLPPTYAQSQMMTVNVTPPKCPFLTRKGWNLRMTIKLAIEGEVTVNGREVVGCIGTCLAIMRAVPLQCELVDASMDSGLTDGPARYNFLFIFLSFFLMTENCVRTLLAANIVFFIYFAAYRRPPMSTGLEHPMLPPISHPEPSLALISNSSSTEATTTEDSAELQALTLLAANPLPHPPEVSPDVDAWARYEHGWMNLLNGVADSRQLTFYDIPWPVAVPVRSQSAVRPNLAHFVAYALRRTQPHSSVTFRALCLLLHLKNRFPAARGSSGHRLYISAPMITSKVICDDTYSNKSWCVVSQGMFTLHEMEREMCGYLEDLRDFEATVRKEYGSASPAPAPIAVPIPGQPTELRKQPTADFANVNPYPSPVSTPPSPSHSNSTTATYVVF
ncbi:hypothetical protein FRC10_003814 [Ceratobasidium sp. 414]|nr:hypothetical protein FRC10_003814 [Ceratobasidium sp. 414]